MAVYRVTLDFFFDNKDEILAFRDYVKNNIFPKIRNVVEEKSSIRVHVCHHDEIPPLPCEPPLYEWVKA